jgi:predicted amidohydrolase YtcJ
MAAAVELILHGGPILTMETAQPRAEAIAIAGGQIVAVGERAALMALAGPATRQVDLGGRSTRPISIPCYRRTR